MDKREELEERLSIMEGNVTSSAERVREAQDLVIAQQAIAEIWLKNVAELRRQLAELDEPTEWVADVNKPFEYINSLNGVVLTGAGIYSEESRQKFIDFGNAYEPNTGNAQSVADARQAMVNIRRTVGEVAKDDGEWKRYMSLRNGVWSQERSQSLIPNAIYIGDLNFAHLLIAHAEDFAKIRNCIDRGLNII